MPKCQNFILSISNEINKMWQSRERQLSPFQLNLHEHIKFICSLLKLRKSLLCTKLRLFFKDNSCSCIVYLAHKFELWGALSIKYIKNIFSSYTTNKCSGNVTFYHRYKADPEFLETTSQKKWSKEKLCTKVDSP